MQTIWHLEAVAMPFLHDLGALRVFAISNVDGMHDMFMPTGEVSTS